MQCSLWRDGYNDIGTSSHEHTLIRLQVIDEVRPNPAGVPSLGPFIAEAFQRRDWAEFAHRAALFIYTSGTTGAPKGAAHGRRHCACRDSTSTFYSNIY